eukprot:3083312-Pleurochrysis_carterae.AAC.1
MKQAIVEDSVLWDKGAEEGSDVGRHLEQALRVHSEPRAEGIELLKASAAASISHGIRRTKH